MKKISIKIKLRELNLLLFLLISSTILAQKIDIKGTVISDEDNQPLVGVTVIEKGTKNGTVTNNDGQYNIAVSSPNSILQFSMIGMENVEEKVGNRKIIDVRMFPSTVLLDQIVVTGYTTEKKADITGAVSVAKISDVISIPTGNIMSSLQGRLPGVNITYDGQPGGTTTAATIRGITTINNSAPLYVIDGVQTRSNIATLLNSNDVESIQVLKDAAAASIYGTQAANGVIIITTKKGEKGKTKINFDTQLTTQKFHTKIALLNAMEWGEVYWKAYLNDGVKPSHDQYGSGDVPVIPEYIDADHTMPAGDTDWQKEVYQDAFLQNYNLSVSTTNKNSASLFSFNYFDQNGLIKYTNFSRYNVRLNNSYSFLDNKFRVGENMSLSNWSEILKPSGIEELVIAQHPLIPVYDINGGYAGPTQGLGDKPNPVRLLDQQKDNRNFNWRIFGNLYLEIEPIHNMIYKSNFSINYRNGYLSNFEPKWSEGSSRVVDKNSLYVKSDYDREWIWSNTASYNFDLSKHTFNFLLGMEAKESVYEYMEGKREEYLVEYMDYRYLSAGQGKQTNGGLMDRTTLVSYFGKLNYDFNDKYLFSATLRNDASSRFGKNNNSAYFPAFSLGWRISQEEFLKNINWISDLKLRASWGKNGNDQMDNEATYTKYLFDLNKAGYDLEGINQGVIYSGIIKQRTGNPDIKWEVSTQTNFGLDIALLKNRLNFTVDYYLKKTDDMLIDRPYIAVIGEGGYMSYNGASLKNNGFEGILTWRDMVNKDFSYEISFSATTYKNKITSLPEDIYYTWGGGNGIDKSIVGQPLGSWFGYKTKGLYRTEDDLNDGIDQSGKGIGRIRYVDLNNDSTINDLDRTWLGTDLPKFVGGLNIAVTYKSFDFSMFFNGMIRKAWNNSKFYTDFFQLWTGNHGKALLNAFDPISNPNSNIPALTAVNTNEENRSSDYFIEDGSYLKLKNLQIGYSFPKKIISKVGASRIRMYFQGQDILTFTNYTGPDPEILGYQYPIPRTYTFGINFDF
ncbi:MAG: TonB-dependent receptor [Paludibacteraceae bacterium]|nr:TonB-dependent receptor [Paludibacteraceae bacterium]